VIYFNVSSKFRWGRGVRPETVGFGLRARSQDDLEKLAAEPGYEWKTTPSRAAN